MVTEGLMVAGEAQQVADAKSIGPQQVTLDGDPVSVTAGHLDVGFQAQLHEDDRHRDRRHADHSRLIVGDVDRLDDAFQVLGLALDLVPFSIWGGPGCRLIQNSPPHAFSRLLPTMVPLCS
jgi:hypothetical protein